MVWLRWKRHFLTSRPAESLLQGMVAKSFLGAALHHRRQGRAGLRPRAHAFLAGALREWSGVCAIGHLEEAPTATIQLVNAVRLPDRLAVPADYLYLFATQARVLNGHPE